MDWQPIETAPKDESSILGFDKNDGPVVAEWHKGFEMWFVSAYAFDLRRDSCELTHWMPLPDPPVALPRAERG